jgi:hypothetical protein
MDRITATLELPGFGQFVHYQQQSRSLHEATD